MGFGVSELLILLLIVALLFGTKKLRSLGNDFGSAVKGFRNAVKDNDDPEKIANSSDTQNAYIIESKAEHQNSDSEKN